jgi:hypothetical protein
MLPRGRFRAEKHRQSGKDGKNRGFPTLPVKIGKKLNNSQWIKTILLDSRRLPVKVVGEIRGFSVNKYVIPGFPPVVGRKGSSNKRISNMQRTRGKI